MNQLFYSDINNSSISNIAGSHNVTTETNINSIKLFISTIPQSSLLICILILFIIFLILIIIILIYIIKKKKKLLQTETIVNNNIDINKMILKSTKNSNSKDFHVLKNNSDVNEYSIRDNNISLSELKTKNLKEEIHCIVSETLSEMSLNKTKKIKKRKKENKKEKNEKISVKIETNNENTNKLFNTKTKN